LLQVNGISRTDQHFMLKKSSIAHHTQLLKHLAETYGFDSVGVSKAVKLEEEAKHLESWLHKGYHGEMAYLEDHFDLRLDPSKFFPAATTIISFAFNYFPEETELSKGDYKIARYAYGRDYHKVVIKKLKKLIAELKESIGDFHARAFVDSAPIMEREWAERSGLGWKGKNTLLINKNLGSYYILAEIVCDLELEYDEAPSIDHCGTCTKCIDACPTDAIAENGYILDASKCISYLTIERKNEIPVEFKEQMEGWIFGCDICQEVCPWNRFSTPTKEEDFRPNEDLTKMRDRDWEEITQEVFDHIFFATPVKRAQYKGLKRNIDFIKPSQ